MGDILNIIFPFNLETNAQSKDLTKFGAHWWALKPEVIDKPPIPHPNAVPNMQARDALFLTDDDVPPCTVFGECDMNAAWARIASTELTSLAVLWKAETE